MIRAANTTPLEQRLTGEQIKALLPYGTELSLLAGDYLFDESSVVDSFYVVLEGKIRISRLDGAEETQLLTHYPGDFTGGLAVLTGRRSIHRGRAVVASRVLEIDSEMFRRVASERPEIADVFISGLGRRMRQTQRAFRQQEKMAALGKLSAGLAHELNNPAAAARRASEDLSGAVLKAQLLSLEHDERFSPAQRESLAELRREATANGEVVLDPLVRSDREDEVALWLEERGLGDVWNLAPTLVAVGLEVDRLEKLAEDFEDERALTGALEWLAATLEIAGLANEVGGSAARISELVEAIKEHTYMDRGSYGETDVREGLESALTILGHKLKGTTVTRDYEEGLPRVWAHAGELNQVWINLLDNATDAVKGQGRIGVRAYRDGDSVAVEVSDDGPGIPREIRARVFEPFFTTKRIGEGTGLGLDIVRRAVEAHGGEVAFDSEPGHTRFVVRLPIESRQEAEGG
jgi:signal transduction histidine kinase